jgi:hypothetical protein
VTPLPLLGEIYPAFLETGGDRQHPRTAGARSYLPVGTCLSTTAEVREFAQGKSLKLSGLASDLGRSARLCGLNLLERRLGESHATVIIPFDDRVIFVRLLNRAEFSSWLSEVAQTLDPISGTEFLVGSRGLGERWLLGTV